MLISLLENQALHNELSIPSHHSKIMEVNRFSLEMPQKQATIGLEDPQTILKLNTFQAIRDMCPI